MKNTFLFAGLFFCLTVVLAVAQPGDAGAEQQVTAQAQQQDVFTPAPEAMKKCSFNSDCPYGKCSKGQCGACSFSSECKGFGTCSGGRCTKSPY